MGLLDYEKLMGNPLLMAGLGILSNNNSRNAGQVIGNGLMQGFGNVAQFQEMQRKKQAQEQEQKMRQAQFDMQKSEYERKISEQQNRQSAMQRLLGGQQSYMKEQEVPFSYQQNVPMPTQEGAQAPNFGLQKETVNGTQRVSMPDASKYMQDITAAGFGDELLKRQLFPAAPELMFAPNGDAVNKNDASIIGKNFAKAEDSQQNPNKPFMIVDGKIVPNEAYQRYELARATAGASKNTVIGGSTNVLPEKFTDKLNGLAAERLMGQFDEGRNAYTAISAVKDAKDLLDRGMFTGKLGPYKENMASWYQGVTGKKLDSLDATQQFRTVIGDIVLPALSNLKGASSDRDFIKIEEYSRGASDMTETALKGHLNRLYNKYSGQLKNFNRGYDDYRKSGGVELPGVKPFDEPKGNLDAPKAPAASAPQQDLQSLAREELARRKGNK